MRNGRYLGAMGLAFSVLFTSTAHADIIPSGQKSVRTEVRLALGPLDGRVWLEYTIKTGDTLSEIAKEWLGSAARWTEIVTANDGLEPRTLKPGQKILLPPRHQDGETYHLFVVDSFTRAANLSRVGADLVLPPMRYGFWVYAVPPAALEAFRACFAGDTNADPRERIVKVPGVRASERFGVSTYASSASSVARRVATFRLERLDDKRLVFATEEQEFDRQGRLLTGMKSGPRLALLAVGLVGLAGLVGVAMRRRLTARHAD